VKQETVHYILTSNEPKISAILTVSELYVLALGLVVGNITKAQTLVLHCTEVLTAQEK